MAHSIMLHGAECTVYGGTSYGTQHMQEPQNLSPPSDYMFPIPKRLSEDRGAQKLIPTPNLISLDEKILEKPWGTRKAWW